MSVWRLASMATTFLALTTLAAGGEGFQPPDKPASQRRRPVAIVKAKGDPWLFVANQASGTIAAIDAKTRSVAAEWPVGRSLADLAMTPDGHRLLAVDQGGNRLVVLDRAEGDRPELVEVARLDVASDPVGIAVSRDGKDAAVASRWSRRLTMIALEPEPRVVKTVHLAFSPRRLVFASAGAFPKTLPLAKREPERVVFDRPGRDEGPPSLGRKGELKKTGPERLVVADAFGGSIAVIDPDSGAVESSRTIPSHNIGGLAVSDDGSKLLLTQQYLNARADTRADDIHWGFLMTNSVRSVPIASLLDPDAGLVSGTRLDHLGEPGRGAGDPSAIVAMPGRNEVVVALSGVGEVAAGPLESPDDRRIAVGRGPSAMVVDDDHPRILFVANRLDDRISVVDLERGASVASIALGPAPAASEVDLGERLFHDATLSHEGWMSCRSCHTDGHASAMLADTLGDGSYGDPKRTLSLLGVADTAPYAWDGHLATLDEQVAASFRTTLRGKAADLEQVRAVSAYLATLPPPPAVDPVVDREAVARGRAVFDRRKCDRCHAPPTYTSKGTYDVGLVDDLGNAEFNPPSLRGVSQRGRLFHDGRARGLEEVFVRFAHPDDRAIAEDDLADLIAFLNSL